MSIVLVGGGSRSGKSRHALALADRYGPRRHFIATAQALDDEMRERIRRHRAERGAAFVTVEEPVELAGAVAGLVGETDVVVIDCVTLWVSNLLASGREDECDVMLRAIAGSPVPCIAVTNEVGCGIVPSNELARCFRDAAGLVNQRAAELATEAYWMAFGLPLRLK